MAETSLKAQISLGSSIGNSFSLAILGSLIKYRWSRPTLLCWWRRTDSSIATIISAMARSTWVAREGSCLWCSSKREVKFYLPLT